LLRLLVDEGQLSVLLVTHDMGVVAEITDRVVVMRHGHVVEQGPTAALLQRPGQDYTRRLLEAVPRLRVRPDTGMPPVDLKSDTEPALVVQGVSKSYAVAGRGFSLVPRPTRRALAPTDIVVRRGTITGIVGESGSGKSTFGRIVSGLERGDSGTISIDGRCFDATAPVRGNGLIGRVQMIFQDPATSLNPRMTIGTILKESCRSAEGRISIHAQREMVIDMLIRLGLPQAFVDRYPHQLSGGQKQRVCIGRALLANPDIIVADEPTSALDVSVQAEIIELLTQCVEEKGLTMIFISHDLAVVQKICGSVYIMRNGAIEEFGPPDRIFAKPKSSYTRSLIEARSVRFTQ
jgi:peptide/nickel transport system ATP-binding protein